MVTSLLRKSTWKAVSKDGKGWQTWDKGDVGRRYSERTGKIEGGRVVRKQEGHFQLYRSSVYSNLVSPIVLGFRHEDLYRQTRINPSLVKHSYLCHVIVTAGETWLDQHERYSLTNSSIGLRMGSTVDSRHVVGVLQLICG